MRSSHPQNDLIITKLSKFNHWVTIDPVKRSNLRHAPVSVRDHPSQTDGGAGFSCDPYGVRR